MDGRAWWITVHWVTKIWTGLSNKHFHRGCVNHNLVSITLFLGKKSYFDYFLLFYLNIELKKEKNVYSTFKLL